MGIQELCIYAMKFVDNTIVLISFFVNICFIIPFICNVYNYFTDKRYLKKVLGYSKAPVQIYHSIFGLKTGEKSTNNFITVSSVKSINYIVSMFNKINQKYNLDENFDEQANEMNIGGFATNKKVNKYIAIHFKDFKFFVQPDYEEKYKEWGIDTSMMEYSETQRGFQIANDLFLSTLDRKSDYAFLIKLTKSDFKGTDGKTVHILFGERDIGTIKAAEYLARYYKDIYKKHRDKHYFIAIQVHQTDESLDFLNGPIDLTDKMFK